MSKAIELKFIECIKCKSTCKIYFLGPYKTHKKYCLSCNNLEKLKKLTTIEFCKINKITIFTRKEWKLDYKRPKSNRPKFKQYDGKESKKEWYRKYLASSAWKEKKRVVIKNKRLDCCMICESKKNLVLHHLSYKRVGREKGKDLRLICNDCHYQCHHYSDGSKVPLTYRRLKERYRDLLKHL